MRVRFTRDWVSPSRVRHHRKGEVANVSNALATHLTQQGTAELVEPASPSEARETRVSVDQYHVGGGWYALPGLDKNVRREEALSQLKGG